MTKERFDIHQHITDKIVSAIERGAGDFRLPCQRRAAGRFTAQWQRGSNRDNVKSAWGYLSRDRKSRLSRIKDARRLRSSIASVVKPP